MPTRPVTADILKQLREERDEADRRYNEALTALDAALPRPASLPPLPPSFDDHQSAALNQHWQILDGVTLPPPRGLRSRLAHFVWRLVAPILERQQAFNSALVDHVNRSLSAARDTDTARAASAGIAGELFEQLATFHAHLIQYLQQVTLYVDTKDRLAAGQLMAAYDAAINALTDELMRRAESMAAREARVDGRVSAVAAEHEELRGTLTTLQQATLMLRREMERLLSRDQASVASPQPSGTAPTPPVASSALLDSYKYVGFEDRFRGSRDDIRARLESYVGLFADASDVLDVGCGRGEFLDLLRSAGISARGLDVNHEMVEVCRERGLDVTEGDLVSYLDSLPDGALGGVIAVQVVEHLEPDYLMRALDLAYHKLRPGSLIVLETINPSCWFAFFASYIRDVTHVRPLHPETLQYLLTASGFQRVRAEFRAPYPDADKLQRLAPAVPGDPPVVADVVETFNGNVERLNGLLFTYLDYAAIGERQ
jgi:O-antigen chain-terminating methyltransferase